MSPQEPPLRREGEVMRRDWAASALFTEILRMALPRRYRPAVSPCFLLRQLWGRHQAVSDDNVTQAISIACGVLGSGRGVREGSGLIRG